MKLYSDLTGRRTAQVLADLFVFGWVCLWVYAGLAVRDATLALRAPGERLRETGQSLDDSMTSVGDLVQDVPFVGDQLQGPFYDAAGAGETMVSTGSDLVAAVERLAMLLGVVTAVVPVLIVVGIWGLLRARFVRRATAAQRFIDADADLDLFALRAMARQPMHRLARISEDPAGAWRRRDPVVVPALARLELRSSGLRPPAVNPGG